LLKFIDKRNVIDGGKGMKQVLGIGIQDFEKLRMTQNFYIDKTQLIKEWWETNNEVTLITRPRRFGKTLNMSMLNCFFSNQFENRGDLFEGLSIWEEEKYRKMQGTYPVIFITFAGIKPDSYKDFLFGMGDVMAELYLCHDYLLESEYLNESQKRDFIKIRDREDADPGSIKTAVKKLSSYLQIHFKKQVMILLDEYDTPLQEAYMQGYWDEVVRFTRGFFHASFKTNPSLEHAILTGITRISKESIFSDFNNLEVITATSEQFETSFGFTEREVFAALEQYGLGDQKEKVKEWYDGFQFGRVDDIYNPWSILNYLKQKKLAPYWANTSSNGLVNTLIQKGSFELKQSMEELLNGGELAVQLDEQIVFNQLMKKKGAVWSLLLAAGYLKITDTRQDEEGEFTYFLRLTNHEVYLMFKVMIRDWFESDEGNYNAFIKALLKGSIKEMNAYMNRIALECFSMFDAGTRPSGVQPERFYHGFVLGLLVELRGRYEVKSNRESGFGRYDVALIPHENKDPAIIIEFKVIDYDEEKTLEDTVQNALEQIQEKQYDKELVSRGIGPERIHHYGFAFRGKEVLIGE